VGEEPTDAPRGTVAGALLLRSHVARWFGLRSEHAAESIGVVWVPRTKQAEVFERLASHALQSDTLLCWLTANPSIGGVSSWLDACADTALENPPLPESLLTPEKQRTLFQQLGHDAMHSSLLRRLFAGEAPLPFDEWMWKIRRKEEPTPERFVRAVRLCGLWWFPLVRHRLSNKHVEEVIASQGGRVPKSYQAFLEALGGTSPRSRLFRGTEIFYPDALTLRKGANDLCADTKGVAAVADADTIVALHQGYVVYFLRGAGDNPPVFAWRKGDAAPRQVAWTLLDFVRDAAFEAARIWS
jgi:hypothetical protein